ncbi:MAG: SLBB domain-containing protein [Verrucomicrobia bacterium]|nr:SLBB domain-containing protein [Verrucomicrobiota bacterium]
MKKIRSSIARLLLLGLIAVVPPVVALDKADLYKKSREEYQQAEHALAQKQATAVSVQKELDGLNEQKVLWEREIVFYRTKLNNAKSQLAAATSAGTAGEVDRWKREIVGLEERVKTAETELARVQGQTTAAIQTLQSSFSDSVEANLIVPGESIEVLVLEDDSFNGVYQVRRGGYIVLPRVGRVYVAGKDVAGAERSVKEALQESQIKDGTVMIERPDGSTTATGPVIYLAGEFSHPGPWRIPPGVAPTVVTTILRSGGVTQSADLTRVRLLRLVGGQPLVEEVNVQAILDGVGLPSDLSLNPGDIIMIPAFANVIYVTGNVVKPGQLKLLPDDELTAYSAILRCGGFSRFANRSKVYLLRDRGNGNKQKIPVSIKNLQNGKTSDVILEPKDIIVVPEKFFSF